MPKRHPNYRLVKTHRNFTVEDVATLFTIHRNTVREWLKVGLPVSDDKRPLLILGSDLAQFLKDRRLKNKKTCAPGEIYCVRLPSPEKAGWKYGRLCANLSQSRQSQCDLSRLRFDDAS